uniref:Saposin B-type domain-containing protein n=1 Tax=Panagrellus redivivus TaxID=6233 RepID=A0A7E4UXK2_PANRE
MNTVTVLVFAALAFVVVAKPGSCIPPCVDYMADIRTKVGNGGKNASIETIKAVLMQGCDPELKEWCTKYSIREAPTLKAWYDSGKTDKMICEDFCNEKI